MSQVTTRPFNPETDSGFIYATWTKGVYYGSLDESLSDKRQGKWFARFYPYISDQLKTAKIYVACMGDDPDTILGYVVINGTTLEWVYVKGLFRKNGIATLLIKNKGIESINETSVTKVGHAIMNSHPNLFKKEEAYAPEAREAH